MYAGFILLPISFYALFNPVIDITEANRWFYLLGTAILIRTAVTSGRGSLRRAAARPCEGL